MHIFLSLISAFSTASYLVYISSVLKKNRFLHPSTTLLGTHLAGGLLLLLVIILMPGVQLHLQVNATAYGYLLVNAVLLMLSRQLYLYAYAHTDVANITIFSPLTPLFAIVSAHLLLGEVLSLYEMLGTLTICISIYFMFLQKSPNTNWQQALLSPFRHILRSVPVLCGFLSTIPTAFATVYQKEALLFFDPVSFTVLVMLTLAGLTYLVEICVRRQPLSLAQTRWRWWLVSGSLLMISQFIFCFVLIAAPTAIALVLQRMSIVFQVLLAYIWLKEKAYIKKRLLCSGGVVTGFALLIYQEVTK